MNNLRTAAGPRRGPKAVSAALRDALSKLEALTDVRPGDDPEKMERYHRTFERLSPDRPVSDDTGVTRSEDLPTNACAIDSEHRRAVRLYVETWIIPLVRDSLSALDGERIPYDSALLDY